MSVERGDPARKSSSSSLQQKNVQCFHFLKVAFTVCADAMLTEQEPLPVQAPLQPLKANPEPAVAVSVTGVPGE